jgi:arabinose-5-phosphate isomerase
MLDCTGRIVVSGMGKSGHIARKIAATLASTGTPAFFVHPGEASHGDLGMITEKPTWCWRCPIPAKPTNCSPSCR